MRIDAPNAKAKPGEAQFFDLKTPLLSSGKLNHCVSSTGMLELIVKVYAEGGENAMHAHPYEDHAFLVLQGEGTFYTGTKDNVRVLKTGEGIMLPHNARYFFQSTGAENLVLLRIGAMVEKPETLQGKPDRIHPDGSSFVADGSAAFEKANRNTIPDVIAPDRFYALT